MERYYKIAGVTYCIRGTDSEMLWEDGVLAPFRCCEEEYTRIIELNVTSEFDLPREQIIHTDEYRHIFMCEDGTQIRYEGVIDGGLGAANMRIERKGNFTSVQIKPQCLSAKSILTTLELEHSVTENSGVLFHGACICIQSKALIFTAPSGTGKSTQADLWCRSRSAELINGDRCIIKKKDDEYFMCGVPYCGSSKVSKNITLPLGAVVYLTQAPKSDARKVEGINSFKYLWEGCCINTWNSSDLERSVELITSAAENVPVIRLDCTPDITAVEELEHLLKELKVLGE